MEYQNNKLTIARTFNAPIALVWKALTELDLLKQWSPFFPDFKAEVGFESRFLLGPDKDHQYMHICRVTEVIEGKKLSYTWAYDGHPGASLVTFDLTAEGETTKIIFTHEISIPFPTDDPNFAFGSFLQGWTYTMDALQKFVEKK